MILSVSRLAKKQERKRKAATLIAPALQPEMPETKEVGESKNPFNGESLGVFETTKKAYKRLRVKSSCPAWLVSRQKQN